MGSLAHFQERNLSLSEQTPASDQWIGTAETSQIETSYATSNRK